MPVDVAEHLLFPTRLVAIQFPDVEGLNRELLHLFEGGGGFGADFDMHPDSLNLLSLASRFPAIARVRGMFLDGLKRWLRAEQVTGPDAVEMVLFSNFAKKGEFTLAHNHNADVVGVYYVQTAQSSRPVVAVPEPDGEYDYFAAEDGALILHDPRFNANLAAVRARDYVKVFPRPGTLVVFPGYVWHSVTPHLGDFHRLALSANFTLQWPGGSRGEVLPLG